MFENYIFYFIYTCDIVQVIDDKKKIQIFGKSSKFIFYFVLGKLSWTLGLKKSGLLILEPKPTFLKSSHLGNLL